MIQIELYDHDERHMVFSLFFDEMPTKDQFMVALCRDHCEESDKHIDDILEAFKTKDLPQARGYYEIDNSLPINDSVYNNSLRLYISKVFLNEVKHCN